ncbi:MAG TPA: twin-arginine translocase subunit TatC, partial [Actinomycetota bacterium]|nr:twin-arginine translocase subunit TatC [Actinomycetota bacterium]
KITAFAGMVFALPVILWQVWRFITPGLHRHEKRYALPFVMASMLLFGLGTLLAFVSLPKTLQVLVSLAGTDFILVPRASEYLSFVLLLIMAFGATFEFPLVLIFLALAGVITSRTLRRGRRIAWVSVMAVAAVVTPTQDPFTMLSLGIPLGLMYEATILVVKLLRR